MCAQKLGNIVLFIAAAYNLILSERRVGSMYQCIWWQHNYVVPCYTVLWHLRLLMETHIWVCGGVTVGMTKKGISRNQLSATRSKLGLFPNSVITFTGWILCEVMGGSKRLRSCGICSVQKIRIWWKWRNMGRGSVEGMKTGSREKNHSKCGRFAQDAF